MLLRDEHVCVALEVNAHTWQGAHEPLDRELGETAKLKKGVLSESSSMLGSCVGAAGNSGGAGCGV